MQYDSKTVTTTLTFKVETSCASHKRRNTWFLSLMKRGNHLFFVSWRCGFWLKYCVGSCYPCLDTSGRYAYHQEPKIVSKLGSRNSCPLGEKHDFSKSLYWLLFRTIWREGKVRCLGLRVFYVLMEANYDGKFVVISSVCSFLEQNFVKKVEYKSETASRVGWFDGVVSSFFCPTVECGRMKWPTGGVMVRSLFHLRSHHPSSEWKGFLFFACRTFYPSMKTLIAWKISCRGIMVLLLGSAYRYR